MAPRPARGRGNREDCGSRKEIQPVETSCGAENGAKRPAAEVSRMREVKIPAFAKINLRLEILGKRPDGYHELRTIFQTVSLHDDLKLKRARKPGIALCVEGNSALSGEPAEKNLVYRAVQALQAEVRDDGGVEIELKKRIPAGRGLGGGSSDAAVAMIGYLRLSGKKVATDRLMEIGASLGADVPFFLQGGRALRIGRRAAVGFTHDQTFVCETLSRAKYVRLTQGRSVRGASRV